MNQLFKSFLELSEIEILLINDRIDSISNKLDEDLNEERVIQKKYLLYKSLRHIGFFKDKYLSLNVDVKYEDEKLTALISPMVFEEVETETPEPEEVLLTKIKNETFWGDINEFQPSGDANDFSKQYDYTIFLQNITKKSPNFIVEKLLKKNILSTLTPEVEYVKSVLWGLRQYLEQENTSFTKWDELLKFLLVYYQIGESGFIVPLNSCLRYGFNKDQIKIDDISDEMFMALYSRIMKEQNSDTTILSKEEEKTAHNISQNCINSIIGTSLEAILFYVLRYARQLNNKEEFKKSEHVAFIKEIFDYLLNKDIEYAYYVLGNYIRNFKYIDKKWTHEKLDLIDDKSDNLWYAFMAGHAYNINIDFKLMEKMCPLYGRLINKKDEISSMFSENITGNIFKAYVWEIPGFNELIDDTCNNIYRVKDVFSYFNSIYKSIHGFEKENKFREKIFEYWEKTKINFKENLYTGYTVKETEDLFREMNYCLQYIEELTDQSKELIIYSVQHNNYITGSKNIIDCLNKLKDKDDLKGNAQFTCEVFTKLNEDNNLPDYPTNDIVILVEYFYKIAGEEVEIKDSMNEICTLYVERGILFLRSLYEKYN